MTIRSSRAFAEAARRYWPDHVDEVAAMLSEGDGGVIEPGSLPPRLVEVEMPTWMTRGPVNGVLLAPSHLVEDCDWRSVDWIAVALWFLDCVAERAHEAKSGPIHSYSLRLRGWDDRHWSRAWVNRIAMSIRTRLARDASRDESAWFGQFPAPRFDCSHDLDALRKHASLRVKQATFRAFNGVRSGLRGRFGPMLSSVTGAVRFIAFPGDYDCLDAILRSESDLGVPSVFHVFPGGPRRRLFDPKYDVRTKSVADRLRMLRDHECEIGLHPGFDAFDDHRALERGAESLNSILGIRPTRIRQHWLRFTFSDTWIAQQRAGFLIDSTLGFNDRPGFRAAAAMRFKPLLGDCRATSLIALPLILMDSHLHDYLGLESSECGAEADRWIDEVIEVGGEGSINWHQRVIHPDYGWAGSWSHVLSRIAPHAGGRR